MNAFSIWRGFCQLFSEKNYLYWNQSLPNLSLTMDESNANSPLPILNHDGTVMLDHRGQIVYRNKFLSTNPLKKDCKQRVGYGGSMLHYLSGECVIRTMNAVFGYSGWSTEVTMEKLVVR